MQEGKVTEEHLIRVQEAWHRLDVAEPTSDEYGALKADFEQALSDLDFAVSSLARGEARERRRAAIVASELERQRWAMELHDDTLQDLGALRVMHEGALKIGEAETMRRSLIAASAQIEDSIASLETLIHMLRPATLDQLGVAAAIENLVERINARHPIQVSAHVDLAWERGRAETRLDPQIESTIYRVVQEGVNNAAKHSQGTTASVTIIEVEGTVTVVIEDDGKGFSPSQLPGNRFGLSGMHERIDLVEGSLEIDSTPGKGTCIEVHVPANHLKLPAKT